MQNLKNMNATLIREIANIRNELQAMRLNVQADVAKSIDLVGVEKFEDDIGRIFVFYKEKMWYRT